MPAIEAHYLAVLKDLLERDYIRHLPDLIAPANNPEQNRAKNISRAFSAFFISNECELSPEEATRSVVDDFDDGGLDAIHYHGATGTLYLIQAKLKESEQFTQQEALRLKEGAERVLALDLDGFNAHILTRREEIENAIDGCTRIQIVIAHVGSGISMHATESINRWLAEAVGNDPRLNQRHLDYGPERVVQDLLELNAHKQVDEALSLENWNRVEDPRETHFGLAKLRDLVELHRKHGKILFDRNIRAFLGMTSDVNSAIRRSLLDQPGEFLYLNNGVTILCEDIQQRGPDRNDRSRKRIALKGLSVINGAQTIATASALLDEQPNATIDGARVHLTVIKASADGEFGNKVTTARNHQNNVARSDFAALQEIHERLRREMLHLGHEYAFKADASVHREAIRFDEAAYALALFQLDPRFPVWVKQDPKDLLVTGTDKYNRLFPADLRATTVINAVLFRRYLFEYFTAQARTVADRERAIYKHGIHIAGWVLAKRLATANQAARPWTTGRIRDVLATHVDQLRSQLAEIVDEHAVDMGPLAMLKNLTRSIPALKALVIRNYGLEADDVPERIIAASGGWTPEQHANQSPLFNYLIGSAPQIVGL